MLNTDDLKDFRTLIAGYYAGWSFRNAQPETADARRFYAPDGRLVLYDTQPPTVGFPDVETLHRGVAERAAQGSVAEVTLSPRLEDIKGWRLGDIAWTWTPYHVSGAFVDQRLIDVTSRQTHVWERRDGRWLIVHEHTAPPLGPPASGGKQGRVDGWPSLEASPEDIPATLAGPADEEFSTLIDRYCEGWSRSRETKELIALYAEGDECLAVDPGSPDPIGTLTDLIERRGQGAQASLLFKRRGAVRAWRRAEIAWLTLLIDIQMSPLSPSKPSITRTARLSLILVPAQQDWSVVHEHLSFASVAVPEA